MAGDATLVTSTTTALTSNPNPSGFGSAVSFVATVETGAGTGDLTGTASFFDGATPLITGVHLGASSTAGTTTSARASFTAESLAVGSHAITAQYLNSLDPTHFPSTSEALIQVVVEGTSTSLASSTNPSLVGQSITLTATAHVVASGVDPIPPDGTVTFSDGENILCTTLLSSAEVATCTTATLAVGVHALSAAYSGDAANHIDSSTSLLLRQDVREPSITSITSSVNPSQYGTAASFTVSVQSNSAVAPMGTVNLLDGGRQIASAPLGPTGATTFISSTLAVGLHTMTASYPGDTNNSSSFSSALSQAVIQVQTTTQGFADPNPAIAGIPVSLTATVKATEGAGVPSGAVVFADTFNGLVTPLGLASLAQDGTAVLNPLLAAGAHAISVAYAGDVDTGASISAPLALSVVLATTSTALTATPNSAQVEAAIALTATVTGTGALPTGRVSFVADSVLLGTASLTAARTATWTTSTLAAGTHSMVASYAGDLNNQPSTSPAIGQVVVPIPTVTALGASSTTGANAEVILLATVMGSSGPVPTGTISFTVGATTLGSAPLNANGVATLAPNLAIGNYSVVALYPGDALHASSQSPPVAVLGMAAAFTVDVTPSTVTLATTQSVGVAVALVSFDNFSDTIGLGCSSLPAGVACDFAPDVVTLAANGALSVPLTIDADNPISGSSAAAKRRNADRSFAGLLLPFGLVFGWAFRRSPQRKAKHLTRTLLVLLASLALLADGCTAITQRNAAPGTYVIQVNATGLNSHVVHYQNVTLHITR